MESESGAYRTRHESDGSERPECRRAYCLGHGVRTTADEVCWLITGFAVRDLVNLLGAINDRESGNGDKRYGNDCTQDHPGASPSKCSDEGSKGQWSE